jgi:hypothetical protein
MSGAGEEPRSAGDVGERLAAWRESSPHGDLAAPARTGSRNLPSLAELSGSAEQPAPVPSPNPGRELPPLEELRSR